MDYWNDGRTQPGKFFLDILFGTLMECERECEDSLDSIRFFCLLVRHTGWLLILTLFNLADGIHRLTGCEN